ncbi:MAG: selenide, water dikinase SelD [Pseudomonadota bacterium]
MERAIPLVRDVVLVGGGHAHALVLRNWGIAPVPGARLTVVHPGPSAPYSGMLPGHIAGHYPRASLELDIVRLARFASARLIVGAVTALDPQAKTLTLPGRGALAYDILSLDVGVSAEMPEIPGFTAHALPAKPLDRLADGWSRFTASAPDGAEIAIIGGGVAGAELAMAARHRLAHVSARVTLIERGQALGALRKRVAQSLRRSLDEAGIVVIEGAEVAAIDAHAITLRDGRQLPSDCTIGAAGARPHSWIAASGLDCEAGFLRVDATLRALDDRSIYGAGDCVHLIHAPRPKAGVFAVRAAPVLAHNLRADLTGQPRRRFEPQGDYLKLVSLGRKAALGEKSGLLVKGDWVWRWKDGIDRRFMDRLTDLPSMPARAVPAQAARGVAAALAGPAPCGGCGAKIGPGALAETLAALPASRRTDIALGPGDDSAILAIGEGRQVISTDHLRGFAEDPVLVTRTAMFHAMGDVWAMGAEPQAALLQITLPQQSDELARRSLNEIMKTAHQTVAETGAEIVGGHSSMGAELQIGVTVTGMLKGPATGLSGAQPGDALILTRGIGSGVILAAEMANRAAGPDVVALWSLLGQPQGSAAAILVQAAHAMTDVTGFGLAGHLWEICAASGFGAELSLTDIPLLCGAKALAEQGISATLLPQNRAYLASRIRGKEAPWSDLLFDPQTAGGLLAAIPGDAADKCVAALRAAGHDAAQIGRITDSAPNITRL